MDTIDRPDPNIPARYSADSSRMPAPIAAMSRDLAVAPTASAPQITPRVLLRGLSRHWWRITLCWLVLSVPLAYLIYALVEPTFDAVSLLRVEPMQAPIFSQEVHGNAQMQEVRPYLQTQVSLIKSSTVLEAAIASPAIKNLPMVVQSKDAVSELKRGLSVGIVGDTYLIHVALGSRDPGEAAAIVNAVVDAYLDQHGRHQQTVNRLLKKNFETEREKLEKQIVLTGDALTDLVKQGNVKLDDRMVLSKSTKDDNPGSSFTRVAEGTYATAAAKLFDMDMQLLEAQAALETARTQHTRRRSFPPPRAHSGRSCRPRSSRIASRRNSRKTPPSSP